MPGGVLIVTRRVTLRIGKSKYAHSYQACSLIYQDEANSDVLYICKRISEESLQKQVAMTGETESFAV